MREQAGILVRTLGNYFLPSLAVGWITLFYQPDTPALKWVVSIAVGLGTGLTVFAVAAIGDRIANGGVIDSALKRAVRSLARFLRAPQLEHVDPKYAPLRVTVFVPKRAGRDGRELLHPKFRWFWNEDKILSYGEQGFASSNTVGKGDALVGLSWRDSCSRYESFRALADFQDEESRLRDWARQWQDLGSGDPSAWGEYARNVRSSWTFPILDPAEDPPRCLAVIAVDSTLRKAFHAPEESSGEFSRHESSCLAEVRLREVIVGHVQSVVLVMLKRRRLDVFRTHFLDGSKKSQVALSIKELPAIRRPDGTTGDETK